MSQKNASKINWKLCCSILIHVNWWNCNVETNKSIFCTDFYGHKSIFLSVKCLVVSNIRSSWQATLVKICISSPEPDIFGTEKTVFKAVSALAQPSRKRFRPSNSHYCRYYCCLLFGQKSVKVVQKVLLVWFY